MAAHNSDGNTPSPLLGLPPEIRNIIWRFTVVEGTIHFDPANGVAPNPPALLEVNRQIREEATDIYHSENKMVWYIEDFDASAYARWERASAARRDDSIEIAFRGRAVWKNLEAWLKLFNEGCVTGFESAEDSALPMVETAAQMFEVIQT